MAGERRVAPGRLAQPLEHALIEALGALRRLDRARHGQAVDHAAEHGEVHRVAGVEDLPARADTRLHEHVVCARELQEQDVEQKAVRLTFSEIGFAPSTIAPIAYQTATCAETLICWDE